MVKIFLHIQLFLLPIFLTAESRAQVCKPRSFQGFYIVSPGILYYYKSQVGVNVETGVILPSSHFVFTVKGNLWNTTHRFEILHNDKLLKTENDFVNATVMLKSYYVPRAFTSAPKKWALGCGAGFYLSEYSKGSHPALDLSTAYLIKLSGTCSDQQAYIRIETSALVTSQFINPSVSINMFLLL